MAINAKNKIAARWEKLKEDQERVDAGHWGAMDNLERELLCNLFGRVASNTNNPKGRKEALTVMCDFLTNVVADKNVREFGQRVARHAKSYLEVSNPSHQDDVFAHALRALAQRAFSGDAHREVLEQAEACLANPNGQWPNAGLDTLEDLFRCDAPAHTGLVSPHPQGS